MNVCVLNGRLTSDIELRYGASGTAFGQSSIALTEKWKDPKTEEKREKTSFITLKFFGKTAENAANFFKKGDGIMVEGKVQQDIWEDKQTGDKKSSVYVLVERFHFAIGQKKKTDDQTAPGSPIERNYRAPAARPTTPTTPTTLDNEDDVPF